MNKRVFNKMNKMLNFARKWRPKTFDKIIGQDLAVKLIKNSLYREQLFPVYLFAGQRGCGKTTLARVFASAINCCQFQEFLKDPIKSPIPCLKCSSCQAMLNGEHPDFNEIDAASHTGVDNVREIIESATFMPGLGKKKVYLIDEAHMLSKAAFNAFLKILEEPPTSVVFMLATTDPQKILETVRSRCFQVFLTSVSSTELTNYLEAICKEEKINYEKPALELIAQESEGSVREGLTFLEQINLLHGEIKYEESVKILGDISYEEIMNLLENTFEGNPKKILEALNKIDLKNFSAVRICQKVVTLLRELIFINQELSPNEQFSFCGDKLKTLAKKVSFKNLVNFLDIWYKAEPLLIKTQSQHTLLEMNFIQMASFINAANTKINTSDFSTPIKKKINFNESTIKSESQDIKQDAKLEIKTEKNITTKSEPLKEDIKNINIPENFKTEDSNLSDDKNKTWTNFKKQIFEKNDPLVFSIFRQAICTEISNSLIKLSFDKKKIFLKDLLEQTKKTWEPELKSCFGKEAELKVKFDKKIETQIDSKKTGDKNPKSAASSSVPQTFNKRLANQTQGFNTNKFNANKNKPKKYIDLKDTQKWPKVHTILKHFPGVAIQED